MRDVQAKLPNDFVKTGGRALGGRGSGYYRRNSKETTDSYKSVDVNLLNRKHCIRIGQVSSFDWWSGDKHLGNIDIHSEDDRLVLEYRQRVVGGEWENISEFVPLSRSRCYYGGDRPWFICPGVKDGVPCRRRVTKLYLAGKYFFCRHCCNLTFASQRESKKDRMLRRGDHILNRLRRTSVPPELGPCRPKGMHLKTYDRLLLKLEQAAPLLWGK